VDRIFAIGGAGAIAAMALGTESVPRVDRVVGPGNAYVASAKKLLSNKVLIDSPAGPSELLVICNDAADPSAIASEMMAQAEHDPNAAVVVVVVAKDGIAFVGRVLTALADAIASTPRRQVIGDALRARGAVVHTSDLASAECFANEWAPEHLLLLLDEKDLSACASRIKTAGTIFLGNNSSVAFGDYMTGANHVLPTGGAARSYSGLSTLDFVRWTTWQRVDENAAKSMSADVALLADAEGLPAHAAAAVRFNTEKE
jgi:histidinol dehydrogenase